MPKETIRTAIVLQGGGAYGAYEYGAIKAIYDKGIRPDVVTGVSIGAINAAVIAGCKNDDPVAAVGELWERLSMFDMPGIPNWLEHLFSLPYNPGMYYLNPQLFYAPFLLNSYSKTDPLKRTLNDLIDWKKLNDPQCPVKLAVTAVNVRTGEHSVFTNYKDPAARKERDIGPPLCADHIVASGSMPPAFPMTMISDEPYWDGGLFSNTPLRPAIKAIQAIEDKDGETVRRKIIVLSLLPCSGVVPGNLFEVESRKNEIAFEYKVGFDKKLIGRIKEFKKFAKLVSEKLPDDPDIKKDPGFQRLMAYKEIHDIMEIRLDTTETAQVNSMLPGSNFTKEIIRERVKLGENITRKMLK